MEILLDTNFILTCVLQKIDFVELSEEMFNEKLNWILPKQVISELKKIENDLKQKRKFRDGAKLSLEILETIFGTIFFEEVGIVVEVRLFCDFDFK